MEKSGPKKAGKIIVGIMRSLKLELEKHRNFIIYLIVGAGISGTNIFLLYLLIDIFGISTLVSSTVVVGGTFVLRFFIYKWTGFTK